MRIINITANLVDALDSETLNVKDQWFEVFQLKCAGVVLAEEEAPYESDGDDLEQWAAEKLKGLFK